ncbi:Uncharacterised protein [Pseudomonas aeruginosa]|nr:Uncharacterised protein [Pseudomonas aeruginosa]
MDHPAVTEANFVLGRVHVDVHHRRIDFEEQHEGRMPAVVQHVAISLAHRVGDQLVAHHAPVHIEVLQVRLAAREGRQADPTPQVQAVALDLDRQRLLEECLAAHRADPARAGQLVSRLVQGEDGLAVVAQVESHVETGQRQALDDFLQMVELGLLGAQELAPRRGVEEQVANLDAGPHRVRRRLYPRLHVTALGFHLPGFAGVGGTRGHGQARYRTDRGQRLATEAEAHHPLQVFQLADLAGGVASQGQRQVVGGDAATVVAHSQQLDAALLDLHINAPGTGVKAVFQEFLGHRGGTLDHLTGGDLVRQPRTQQLDTRCFTHHWAARAVLGMDSAWPTFRLSLDRLLLLRSAAMLTS